MHAVTPTKECLICSAPYQKGVSFHPDALEAARKAHECCQNCFLFKRWECCPLCRDPCPIRIERDASSRELLYNEVLSDVIYIIVTGRSVERERRRESQLFSRLFNSLESPFARVRLRVIAEEERRALEELNGLSGVRGQLRTNPQAFQEFFETLDAERDFF